MYARGPPTPKQAEVAAAARTTTHLLFRRPTEPTSRMVRALAQLLVVAVRVGGLVQHRRCLSRPARWRPGVYYPEERLGRSGRPWCGASGDGRGGVAAAGSKKLQRGGQRRWATAVEDTSEDVFPPAEEEKETRREKWERLVSLVDKDWGLVVLGFVFLVCAALSDVAIPHFSSQAVNAIVANAAGDVERSVWAPIKGLVLASSFAAIFTACRGTTFWLAGTRVVSRLRGGMFDNVLKQEVAFFDTTPRGVLTSRLSSDASKVADVVSFNLNIIARQLIMTAAGVGYLFWLDAPLALVCVSSMMLAAVLTQIYGAFARDTSKKTQDALAKANAVADEAIENVRVVRSFAADSYVAGRYRNAVARAAQLQERHGYGYGASRFALGLAKAATTVAILAVGELRRAKGLVPAETLVTFIFVAAFVQGAAFDVGEQVAKVDEALGAGAAAFQLATRRPLWGGRAPPAGGENISTTTTYEREDDLAVERGRVELSGVTFAYPARKEDVVLQDVSLNVPPKNKVALVGSSGSGKSSVTRLLLRHYEADSGAARLDGVDVRDLPQAELARRVAYVEQEPRLFDGSIADNIRFGLDPDDPAASDAAVRDAAQRARVSDFADALPNGLDTRVGAAGGFLSGGQKARVAVARALVRSPDLIILDEPTAALDARSEQLVQQALDAIDCSMLVVAHRLSTIQQCDEIYVMQSGRVVEQGTHQQLLRKRDGVYAAMVAQQNLIPGEGSCPRFDPKADAVLLDDQRQDDACLCDPTTHPTPNDEQDELVHHERG